MDVATIDIAGPSLVGAEVEGGMAQRLVRAAGPRLLPLILLLHGLRQLVSRSLIPGWQPGTAFSTAPLFAIIDGAMLVMLSGLAITGPRRDIGAWGLALLLAVWIVALQGPGIVASPGSIALWLGVAEVGALAAAATLIPSAHRAVLWRTGAFVLFGLCCCVFGVSHFVYADFTAKMIPSWFPARLALAYLTGSAHIAAGLAIGSGVWRRPAALLLALMMALFVLFVHIPAILSPHAPAIQWIFLLNACALCGSALAVGWASGITAARTHPAKARRGLEGP